MKILDLIEQLELLKDLKELREYGLTEEEILGYLEWDSELPKKANKKEYYAN